MILITGANGHLGTATIDFFRQKNPDIPLAGLVRSIEKGKELKAKGVEVRVGDYLAPSSLHQAFKGVDTLLLISSSTIDRRVEQHKNAIEAAEKAGVQQIIYTSMVKADQKPSPLAYDHADTEEILEASGISVTLSRHTFYTEFFPMFLGNALESGQWSSPSSGHKVNFAYRTDMAEALANILSDPKSHQGKTYELTSGQAHTFEELAQILSEAAGKKITYTDVPVHTFTENLTQAGLSREAIGMATLTAQTVSSGALDITKPDLEKLLGRRPKSTETFIRNFVSANG